MSLTPLIACLLLTSTILCKNTTDSFDVSVSSSYGIQSQNATAQDRSATEKQAEEEVINGQSYLVHENFDTEAPFLPTPQPYVYQPEPEPRQYQNQQETESTYANQQHSESSYQNQQETDLNPPESSYQDQQHSEIYSNHQFVTESSQIHPTLPQIQNVLNTVNANELRLSKIPKNARIVEIVRVPAVYELHVETDADRAHSHWNLGQLRGAVKTVLPQKPQGFNVYNSATSQPLSYTQPNYNSNPSFVYQQSSQNYQKPMYKQQYKPAYSSVPKYNRNRYNPPKSSKSYNRFDNQYQNLQHQAESNSVQHQTPYYNNRNYNFDDNERFLTGEYFPNQKLSRGQTKYVNTVPKSFENKKQVAPEIKSDEQMLKNHKPSYTPIDSKMKPKIAKNKILRNTKLSQKNTPGYSYEKPTIEFNPVKVPVVPVQNHKEYHYDNPQIIDDVSIHFESKKPTQNNHWKKEHYQQTEEVQPLYFQAESTTQKAHLEPPSNQYQKPVYTEPTNWNVQFGSNYFNDYNTKPQAIHEVPAPVFVSKNAYVEQQVADKVIYGKSKKPHSSENNGQFWRQQHFVQAPTEAPKAINDQIYQEFDKTELENIIRGYQTKEAEAQILAYQKYQQEQQSEAKNQVLTSSFLQQNQKNPLQTVSFHNYHPQEEPKVKNQVLTSSFLQQDDKHEKYSSQTAGFQNYHDQKEPEVKNQVFASSFLQQEDNHSSQAPSFQNYHQPEAPEVKNTTYDDNHQKYSSQVQHEAVYQENPQVQVQTQNFGYNSNEQPILDQTVGSSIRIEQNEPIFGQKTHAVSPEGNEAPSDKEVQLVFAQSADNNEEKTLQFENKSTDRVSLEKESPDAPKYTTIDFPRPFVNNPNRRASIHPPAPKIDYVLLIKEREID